MKKKLVIALVVFTAVAAGIFYLLTAGNIGTRYNTAQVEKGEVGRFVQDTGRISSRNIRKYYGNSSNKVEFLHVQLGDPVKSGQLLIEFEDQLDLEIRKVKKQIEALEAAYSEATSGTDIEKINNAKIEMASINENIEQATRNVERIQALYHNGGVSLTELEQAQHSLSQLQSSLATAQNNYTLLIKGVSGSTRKRYEAEIDVLRLSLASLEERREDSKIYSDIEGIVTEVNTFVGDIPAAGTMMLEVQDPSAKVVLVDFMVADALLVKPGMRAFIVDQKLGVEMDDLEVSRVYPKAFITLSALGVEENRQTVEIGLPESAGHLSYGLELSTRVVVDEAVEALFIPKTAVYRRNGISYVEVLEQGSPVERQIQTGIEDDRHIEVTEGLSEGESVILKFTED
ncbi:MAG: efflux RND transporter periplasmic adaptor subunit [Bacillota bacterium]|nr:efflux RND transporter periplasmic adaptor subunit [Bacillota bacterium]MDW7677931.1 efflux RND transporter periplasmic adaptor subunit [Bacillota bacterium]